MGLPTVRVQLPKPLYAEVKASGLLASELLQEAMHTEVRRRDLMADNEADVAELFADIGASGPETVVWAKQVARRLARRVGHAAS